jgi:hypothetical protein
VRFRARVRVRVRVIVTMTSNFCLATLVASCRIESSCH